MEQYNICQTCGKKIKEDEPYTEIEETRWANFSEGKAVTHYWHDKCGGSL